MDYDNINLELEVDQVLWQEVQEQFVVSVV